MSDMNKRLITMGLIAGTALISGIGTMYPNIFVGIASMTIGATSLALAFHVLKESAKRRIDKIILNDLR